MGLVLSKKNYPKRVIHYPPSRKRLPSGSPGENVGANVEDDEDEEDYHFKPQKVFHSILPWELV